MTPNQSKLATYESGNREAAAIILANSKRYPAGSLLATWAETMLSKAGAAKMDERNCNFGVLRDSQILPSSLEEDWRTVPESSSKGRDQVQIS